MDSTINLLDFIIEQFKFLFQYMKETVVFQPTIFLFDFPVTIWDLSLGFLCANLFLYFFGFLIDSGDVELDTYDDDDIEVDDYGDNFY
ncbi:MAG: hypothetical protein K2L10_05455 [Ruminococcus sp.]|nr:hypothetical protein [Ruminococcus sp.]